MVSAQPPQRFTVLWHILLGRRAEKDVPGITLDRKWEHRRILGTEPTRTS
jgi:hypothetical protein